MTMRRSTFRKSCEGAWPGGLGCAPRNPGASPPFPRAGPRLSPRGQGPWQGHLLTACRRRNALGGSHRRTRYLRWRRMDRETQRQRERDRTERQRQKVRCGKKSSVTLSLWSVIWGGTRTDQLQPSFRTQGECRLPAHPGWVSALLRHRAPGLLLGAWQGRRNPSVFISTFDSARIRKSKVTAGHMVQ